MRIQAACNKNWKIIEIKENETANNERQNFEFLNFAYFNNPLYFTTCAVQ